MSKNQKPRNSLCGNCTHFVAGGRCQLVQGQIKAKDTCDLFEKGSPQSMDTDVEPKYLKTDVNYRPGFMVETTPTGEFAQKVIQMEHELLARGIPEEEVHRAVVAYFSGLEPPPAMPWPGPSTGFDLAATINTIKVPDTGVPLTDFTGLPKDVQPYPTPNQSPYGIGSTPQPYPSFYSPAKNLGSLSNTYNILNYPVSSSSNWIGTASDVNSEPSMHGEHGYNVAQSIPPWRYDIEQSQVYPPAKRDIIIPPSGAITEAQKDDTKKKLLSMIGKWALLLGGVAGMNTIIKNYMDSDTTAQLEIIAEYNYHGHDNDDECARFAGKRFNLLETHIRPVIPSEKLGYTTTHPNCKCTWDVKPNAKPFTNNLTKSLQDDISGIETHITDVAKKGELHKVDDKGKLSSNTTKKNPLKETPCACSLKIPTPKFKMTRQRIRESFDSLREQFGWLTDDYIENAKNLADDADGVLYLIRAAGESITDHRGEGEQYRRKLSADELNSMTRTIIDKRMDINHQPEYVTDTIIIDADFDKIRKEIQTLIIVTDDTINDAIDDGKISAVSINGGMPRSESVEQCDHNCNGGDCELCLVPHGVVLGELDGIGMTFVVTDPRGIYWNGHFIPSAEPGIKFTKIQAV